MSGTERAEHRGGKLVRGAHLNRCYVRSVLVDPEVLRAFAAQVDAVAAKINGMDVGATAGTAANGLPGSDTQCAVGRVGRHLGLAANDIVNDVGYMGAAVRGAGDGYEVADDALAGTFTRLF